jgi:hypothetical protein
MAFKQFMIKPQDIAIGWEGEAMPLGIIDLDAAEDQSESIVLPPFPLIGIGIWRLRRLAYRWQRDYGIGKLLKKG